MDATPKTQLLARGAAHGLAPTLAIVGSALFWGTMWYPIRKVEAAGISGGLVGALIYGLPALPLLPLVWWRRRIIGANLFPLLIVGGSIATCNVFFATAVTRAEIVIVVLLFYLNPIWTTLLERIVLGSPLTARRWGGIGLALIGLAILQGARGRWPWPGDVFEWLGLAGGVCWAIGLVATRVWDRVSVTDKSLAQFVCALPIGALLVLALGAGWPSVAVLSADSWSWLGWASAASLIWVIPALVLGLWGAARMSPGKASILMTSEVVVGVGSAAWLAGEELTWQKLLGGGLIVSGALFETMNAEKAPGKPTPEHIGS